MCDQDLSLNHTCHSCIDWPGGKASIFDERLGSALQDAERRIQSIQNGHPVETARCRRCLYQALVEAKKSNYYAAWDNLHQFEIEYLATLDEKALEITCHGLVEEAKEKLSGWRLKTAEKLISSISENSTPPLQILVQLQKQLSSQSQNLMFKRDLVSDAIPANLALMVVTISFLLLTSTSGLYDKIANDKPMIIPLAVGLLFGFLGGLISKTLAFEIIDLKNKIPHISMSLKIASLLLRPTIGALCSIPVVVLSQSQFISFNNVNSLGATAVLCLITGFSERWFFSVMENITPKTKS